ncbi:MAG: glycosyltransferase [Oscillospiraceae bacterium]|nr:glycosyltransferase [Oscillospiraceae bacterium]
MNFSIVIPTWNRSKLVDALLESLYEERQRYDEGETEVLIVDSSKDEEKASIVASCEKYDARYIDGVDSVRKKRNKGIDLSQYEYILFIDSDVTVKPGLLHHHAETLREGKENPKITASFGLTEFVGKKKFWGRVIEHTSFLDSFAFAKQMPFVSWAIGNNIALRRDELLKIGKFEENFPFKLGGDDLDMTYRYTKEGNLIKTTPEAVTYHSRETWNSRKAVNDRAKRWGTMEYHILKRYPELVHRRLPMTGDVVALVTAVCGLMALLKQSLVPLVFLGGWYVLLYGMMYGYHVATKGKTNPFFWTMGVIQQGKYRFWRLVMSLKKRDLSLAFKGQYFGIYHIRDDYRNGVRKTWLYYISIISMILAMAVYKLIIG